MNWDKFLYWDILFLQKYKINIFVLPCGPPLKNIIPLALVGYIENVVIIVMASVDTSAVLCTSRLIVQSKLS